MSDTNIEELLVRIAEQQQQLLTQLQAQANAPAEKPKKDAWDKMMAVAPIFAACIMASIGAYFTYSYNVQQLHVQEIQTVERFIPHLVGDEKTKRAAILAISSMGNAPLAAKVAKIFASEGTASALRSIAETSDQKDQAMIREALAKTLDALSERYKQDAAEKGALADAKAVRPDGLPRQAVPIQIIEIPTANVQPASSERPGVEAVHAKEPKPSAEAHDSVEADETENQHSRSSVAESAHTKQQ